jgi:hypothetical protein
MTDTFTTPDDGGLINNADFTTSLPEQIGARASQTIRELPAVQIVRAAREGIAGGFAPHDWDGVGTPEQQMGLQDIESQARTQIPDISQSDAKDMLKQEGLSESDVPLGNPGSHKLPVLQMRIEAAHAKRDREAAIERGPQGFFPTALGYVTSLGVGMVDPINLAAFSIPVIGEARMGKILAGAGDSILARTAVRAGEGAVKGAVGTAALQPADWWLHTRDGHDYTMAEALESIVMGAGMGAAFHALPGAYRDWRTRRQGLPLEGTALDRVLREMPQQPEPGATPEPLGARLEEVPGITPEAPTGPETAPEAAPVAAQTPVVAPEAANVAAVPSPGEVLADLPEGVRQDSVHAAMAALIEGKPVQSAEILDIAADHDPRIAETVDPWNAAGEAARAEPLTPQAIPPAPKRGRAAADPRTWSLFEYLASRGGIRPDSDLGATFGGKNPFVPGFGPLMRKGGMSMDDALIAAKEGGYFIDPTSQEHLTMRDADTARLAQAPTFTVRDLMEKIDEESRGKRQYREGHLQETLPAADAEAHNILSELHQEIEAATGQRDIHIDPVLERRVVEIVTREGEHDVHAAYERAIMETEESYNAASAARSESPDAAIPGCDVPDDGRPAPGRGAAPEIDRGIPGSAAARGGGEPGSGPRAIGERNRPPGQAELGPQKSTPAQAAADPRWRQLSEAKPDFDDPETLAESEAAEKLPEPESVQGPKKSLTALDKAAADAEEVWRQLEPTLTEQERALVNDVMDQLKLDADTRAKIISEGAVCLAGAIA